MRPILNPVLPSPSLTHIPKCFIYTSVKTSVTSLGSMFQSLTTLLMKKVFLKANLSLPWSHLLPFPLVLTRTISYWKIETQKMLFLGEGILVGSDFFFQRGQSSPSAICVPVLLLLFLFQKGESTNPDICVIQLDLGRHKHSQKCDNPIKFFQRGGVLSIHSHQKIFRCILFLCIKACDLDDIHDLTFL